MVIAGGEKMETDRDILEMVKGAVQAGGAGVSIGRNAFQHRDPEKIVRAITILGAQRVCGRRGVEENWRPEGA